MPDLAAPVAPAPVAAAPAAPVVTPPVAPATPPVAEPAAAVAAPPVVEAPAAVVPAAPKTPQPKASDFPPTEEGMVEHLNALHKWQDENPDVEVDTTVADPAPVIEEPKPDAAKPEDEKKPDDAAGDLKPLEDDAPDLTPEALNNLIKDTPELGTLLEANPKLNGAFQKMARVNAKAAPLMDMFPTVESAKFAAETSNRTVGLRTAFQLAIEEPERITEAYNMFVDEFTQKDADGKPVLGPDGKPVVEKDFDLLSSHMVGNYHDNEIATIEARLAKNEYASDAAKENDSAALSAYKFIKLLKDQDPDAASKPDISNMDPAAKAWFEAKEKEIAAAEEKLGIKKQQQTKEDRQRVRTEHENNFKRSFGGEMGKAIADHLADLKKQGVHIPSYALQATDPRNPKVSIFAANVYNTFNKWFQSIASYKQKAAELQMLPPTKENLEQRLQFFRDVRNEHLPRFITAELRKLQGQDRQDRESQQQQRTEAERIADVQPRGGATPTPQVLTPAQKYDAAKEKVRAEAKKRGETLTDAEVMEKALTEQHRM